MSAKAVSVWNKCLTFIEDNIQQQAYKTWFLPIIPLKISDNILSIQVPSKFFLRMVGRALC
jgi:chromosomal replication initiator protein